MESIGDAVIATDPAGCVEFINPVAQDLTGWSLQDARGRHLDEVFVIINEDTREQVESPVAKVLRFGAPVGLANHTPLVRRDGSEVPIDDSGAPIRDDRDRVRGMVLVFRDLKERHALERELLAKTQRVPLLLQAAEEMARPLFEEAGVELHVVHPVPVGVVRGDATRLVQVLGNLLSNAVKFSSRGQKVRLHAQVSGGYAEISVVDEGSGISAGSLQKVFDLFYQEQQGLDRDRGGAGGGTDHIAFDRRNARWDHHGSERRTGHGQHIHRAAASPE